MRTFATWEIFRPLRVYAGFDWDSDHWFRYGRGDKDDRLYYYEKRATIGGRFDLRHFGVEVFGGYAYDRFYFEGEGYKDRYDNRRPRPRRSSSAGCTFASEQNSARDGVRGFRRGRLTGAGRRPPA